MATSAMHTKQLLFQRAMGGSPDTYETIGEVTSFDGPSMSINAIDASSFDSTWVDRIVGIPDGGTVTIGFNYVPANGPQSRFRSDFINRTLRSYKITLTNTALTTIVFSAYITAIGATGNVNDKVTGSATLTVTGAVN